MNTINSALAGNHELEIHKEFKKDGHGVSIWIGDQSAADELLKQAQHSDRLADWLNSVDLHEYRSPIDTNALRGVCDLRSNDLDYWRNTARKFIPLAADHIDALTKRAESAEAEVARLRDALKEYADRDNWGNLLGVVDEDAARDWWLRDDDGWEVAENALKGGADDGKDHS